MPPAAMALPLIIGGVGAGASAIGSALSTSAANAPPQQVYPSQTGQYLNMISPLAGQGAGTLSSMIATGNPTDVGPAWNALVAAQQPLQNQSFQQLLGSFSGAGLRYGSDAMTAASNFESQSNNNFLSILANYTMNANEAAAGRQLSASEYAISGLQTPALTTTTPQQSVAGNVSSGIGQNLQLIALLKALTAP